MFRKPKGRTVLTFHPAFYHFVDSTQFTIRRGVRLDFEPGQKITVSCKSKSCDAEVLLIQHVRLCDVNVEGSWHLFSDEVYVSPLVVMREIYGDTLQSEEIVTLIWFKLENLY